MFEVEKKCLVEDAQAFRGQLIAANALLVGTESQLNHYFTGESSQVWKAIAGFCVGGNEGLMQTLLNLLSSSVRTRQVEGEAYSILVAKEGKDSANGGIRREAETKHSLTLEQLDSLLIDSGLEVQAKWSRSRESYRIDKVTICLDKNAGYGYLAEFEIVVSSEAEIELAEQRISKVISKFGLEELEGDRLNRMFAYYNRNWRNYYGTNNTFEVT